MILAAHICELFKYTVSIKDANFCIWFTMYIANQHVC